MRNQWEHMSDHHTFQGQSVAANTVGKGGKTLEKKTIESMPANIVGKFVVYSRTVCQVSTHIVVIKVAFACQFLSKYFFKYVR